ncbi:MAG: DUF6371 domain-containing protein, partial [Bacteroidales bacterium]|nr:DUF6371 domain-containing protein [Bacteroidales bacterium]
YEINIPYGSGEYYTQCPACSYLRKPQNQKKKCFGWSRDINVGHCMHCGSSFVEYRKFDKNEKLKIKSEKFKDTQQINTIDQKYLSLSLGLDSNFGEFLKTNFSDEKIEQVMEEYHLGMTKDKSVIYWYIDEKNRVRSGKIMQYDAKTGKRVKESSISWVHSELKRKDILPNDWQMTRCLFGEHLLAKYPNANVCLFEGEKTAVICSMYFPENICLATGGSEMLSKSVCEALRARKVLVIADCDKVIEWKQKTMEINHSLGLNLKPYDKLNQLLTDEQKEMKWDLADYFLKGTI